MFFSLTSGAAQRGGHSFVHDEQRTVQPGDLHGHLDLLDAGVQSSLPGLLSGEDGVTLTAYLSQRWTLSCRSGRKACGYIFSLLTVFFKLYFINILLFTIFLKLYYTGE